MTKRLAFPSMIGVLLSGMLFAPALATASDLADARENRWFVFGGIMNTLRSTKPYLSVVSGYSHQTSEASVDLKLPLVGKLVHQKQQDSYDLFYVCSVV